MWRQASSFVLRLCSGEKEIKREKKKFCCLCDCKASKSGSRLRIFNSVCLELVPGQIDSPYLIIMSLITIPRDEYYTIHTISQYCKKMISFGNAASSHSGLIPLKTAYKKRGE